MTHNSRHDISVGGSEALEDLPLFSGEPEVPATVESLRQTPVRSTVGDILVKRVEQKPVEELPLFERVQHTKKGSSRTITQGKKILLKEPFTIPVSYTAVNENEGDVRLLGVQDEGGMTSILIEIDHDIRSREYQQGCNEGWNDGRRDGKRIYITKYTKPKQETRKYRICTQDYWKGRNNGITEVYRGFRMNGKKVQLDQNSLDQILDYCLEHLTRTELL